MECICAAAFILLVFSPLLQMLFAMRRSGWRRLSRFDLTAFFVLTAGVAIALGSSRLVAREHSGMFALVFVLTLPVGLAIAWFFRFIVQELRYYFGKKGRRYEDANFSSVRDCKRQ
jgi:hypothetical protein